MCKCKRERRHVSVFLCECSYVSVCRFCGRVVSVPSSYSVLIV